jgi:hypothetical protein
MFLKGVLLKQKANRKWGFTPKPQLLFFFFLLAIKKKEKSNQKKKKNPGNSDICSNLVKSFSPSNGQLATLKHALIAFNRRFGICKLLIFTAVTLWNYY